VVVPTRDRPEQLARSLGAILAAARQVRDEPVEILVVDDGDDRRVADLVAGLASSDGPAVHYIARSEYGGRGPGDARNAGVLRARGDLIAFTDDDTRCREDWLVRGIGHLRSRPEIAGVEGAVVPEPDGTPDASRTRVVHNLDGGAFLTANLFARRDAVLAAGGFQRLWPGGWAAFREDTDLALRVRSLHGPIPFDVDLVVVHPIEHVSLKGHLRTAAFFVVDEPFRRLHPGAIPSIRAAPTARLRIRAACVAALAVPLLAVRRLRPWAAAALVVTAGLQHLQAERDLRLAGVRRSPGVVGRDALRRAGRNLAWGMVAGWARLAGIAAVRTGVIPRRPDPVPLPDEPQAPAAPRPAD
jgi:GT2 family glycosyltransferase